jgi:hypothetical protein
MPQEGGAASRIEWLRRKTRDSLWLFLSLIWLLMIFGLIVVASIIVAD